MSILLADIDATCSALGIFTGDKYIAEPDALQGLKVTITSIQSNSDLIRLISSTSYGFSVVIQKIVTSTGATWATKKLFKRI